MKVEYLINPPFKKLIIPYHCFHLNSLLRMCYEKFIFNIFLLVDKSCVVSTILYLIKKNSFPNQTNRIRSELTDK